MRVARHCVYTVNDLKGNTVYLGYGPTDDPTATLRGAPSVYRRLLDGIDGGRLKIRVLLGAAVPLSRRVATQVVNLLRGRQSNPTRRGRPTVVIDPDGKETRYPTLTAAAAALGTGRYALGWARGGPDAAGRLIL